MLLCVQVHKGAPSVDSMYEIWRLLHTFIYCSSAFSNALFSYQQCIKWYEQIYYNVLFTEFKGKKAVEDPGPGGTYDVCRLHAYAVKTASLPKSTSLLDVFQRPQHNPEWIVVTIKLCIMSMFI